MPLAWAGNPDVSSDPASRAVLFTRVLSFRNFSGLPFVVSAPPHVCALVADKALEHISKPAKRAGRTVWRLAECPPRVIRLLREREILPLRAASFPGKKGFKYLASAPDGGAWTLVNEVEHITSGRIFPGRLDPAAFESLYAPPDEGPARTPWAWSGPFGYLASDPSRIGPGLSVESVVHLPGLALSRQLPHARNYLTAAGVGFLPVGSPSPHSASPGAADAGLFRLTSRGGLGKTPRQVYESFLEAVEPVLRKEREARLRCAEKHHKRLEERVRQSFRSLAGAATLAFAELLSAGSLARLGAALGMLNPQIPGILEELRITAASGHLAVTSGRDLSKEEEDITRANVVRLSLMDHSGEIS
ncbi:MAG: arginine kinase [Fibrobacteres bacterium]|nr:arginine kinase [Fibrobacterota bacterium]